ncbi:MAG: DUF1501 domain-containing protein [Planctomycetes bacterium]|nr:DUF1501 domain-containing protein [Planctomycetota bacterium]
MHLCPAFTANGPLSRRSLLSAGTAGFLGLSLPEFLASQAMASELADGQSAGFGRAKSCILLFMWGGPAHQDRWDLKPNAPREIRGEFQPISTNVPGIQIGEHFPHLAQRTDQLAIIRSMTHNNVDHTPSTHFLLTGQPPPPTGDLKHDWPSMGSVLSKLQRGRPPLPPFVSMRPKLPGDVPRFVEQSHGQFAGWLGPAFDPLTIDENPGSSEYHVGDFDPPAEVVRQRVETRKSLLHSLESRDTDDRMQQMARHYERAFALMNSASARGAFDLSQEPAQLRERYGLNPHGQSVLQARRLIERGVSLVTVFWPNDGIKNVSVYWDTHSRNFIDLKQRLMPVADQAFSTLLDDLKERGLLDETLVIWTGEFGRTPRIGQVNSDAGAGADGRDHWPGCFTSVLAGGGIRGGQVYGSSDRYAAYPASNAVRPMDLVSTVYHSLGVPQHLELHDQQGRPLVVCPGDPLLSLF